MLDLPTVVNRAENICRQVCPDLRGQAVYVLTDADYPPVSEWRAALAGCTWADADLSLRHVIADRWVGRGFGCVMRPSLSSGPQQFIAYVVHELAHWIHTLVGSSPDILTDVLDLGAVCCALSKPRSAWWDDKPAWFNHTLPFQRAMTHLRHRVWCAGGGDLIDELDGCYAGEGYGLSDPAWYRSACAREVRECRDQSLVAVLASDPPAELVELWEQDTYRGATVA